MKINYFNYCALGVCTILMFSTVVRKIYKTNQGRHFFILLITVFLASFFDVMSVNLDNYMPDMTALRVFAHSGYILFHNFTAAMYATYVVSITDTLHIVRKRKSLAVLMSLPFVIILLLLVTNIFKGVIFYFGEQNAYQRGSLFFLLYFFTAYYIAFGTVVMIKYRNSIPFDRWIALMIVVPFTLVSAIFQFLNPKYVIEMFMNSLGILFISTVIQRPEEFMDADTGSRNETAFMTDIKRSFYNKKDLTVVMIKIINHKNLMDMLSLEEFTSVLKQLTSIMNHNALNCGIKSMELSYIKRGIFCAVYDPDFYDKTESYVQSISSYLRKPINLSNVDINCNVCICSVRCPKDIGDAESFSSFLNNFYEKFEETGQYIRAEDIISDKKYSMLLNMEHIINRALTNKNLKVYYQPIYSISEKRFKCAEALVRLIDDEYGFVPPDLFIPEAEKNGTIHKIGNFVFDSVCRFIGSDEFKGLGVDYIDVNLSAVQCMNRGLKDEILTTMEKHKVKPEQVVLEITETAASLDHTLMDETIYSLTDEGIAFSLDDFGTGYSNMSRIAELPLKMGKLDKTFTKIDENSKLMMVTMSSVHMMKSMNMRIVVEGVETEEMLNRFSELGCEFIQGYYFSKPLPEKDYVEFIREKHCISA